MYDQSWESKILRGCRAGKAKYQQMLYEMFYGKMLSVCQRYTQSGEEARDILQEGFIKVFQNLSHFKAEGSLEGWIRRIMINTAITQYHKQRKLQANLSIEEDIKAFNSLSNDDDSVYRKLAYEDLLRLIRELPPAYQTVFNLYAIEGYNHREIAELLQINEGTSKSNLAKARRHLQNKLMQFTEDKSLTRYAG
ncbi:MAG: RNA polymerase sigma factor [Microscillaceae bacterium]